jgi:hypothetical protein
VFVTTDVKKQLKVLVDSGEITKAKFFLGSWEFLWN